jgi:putative transposase
VVLPRGSPQACRSATIMAANTCHGRSRMNCAFSGSRVRPLSCGRRKGNGCAERFIRTLKENLLWVHRFETIEELRQALLAFRENYNSTWLIARHGFQTPAAVRRKQLPIAALAA